MDRTHILKLDAPIVRWDEALPLGNGINGVLLWGGRNTLKLSLDRGDLWDERNGGIYEHPDWNWQALEEIFATKNSERLNAITSLHSKIVATKLPVGRLEIKLKKRQQIGSFVLDMRSAVAAVADSRDEVILNCLCDANMQGIFLRFAPGVAADIEIVPPEYVAKHQKPAEGFVNSVDSLGYAAGKSFVSDKLKYYLQQGAGVAYGIFVQTVDECNYRVLVEKRDKIEDFSELIEKFGKGKNELFFDAVLDKHLKFWHEFWNHSAVKLPDYELQAQYLFCRYLYGSGSRVGAPPMPLQGVWTADDNTLPPWKGDYHHDLNTQMTYLAYLNSGDFDCGKSFFDHLSGQIEVYRNFCRSFYHCDGVAVPGTASLAGQALGGWPQYSFSPTNTVWLALMFVKHYKYTKNEEFLRREVWPFVRGVGEFVLNVMHLDEHGKLRFSMSCSPEIHDAGMKAFYEELTNYDLALLKALFEDLAYLARELGDMVEFDLWRLHQLELPDNYAVSGNGLQIAPGEDLTQSHRHHSHLMAIYPLKLLRPGVDKETDGLIYNSIHWLDWLGTGGWVGFSFTWDAALEAYCGRGSRALRRIKQFLDGLVSRNGFHLNGDYKDLGYCSFKYRPFTLEGNFLCMQAIHEMLLDSNNGYLRIFPGLPEEWRDVSFRMLRGEGKLCVSAELKEGVLTRLEIHAGAECEFYLHKPQVPSVLDEILEWEFLDGVAGCQMKLGPGETRIFGDN